MRAVIPRDMGVVALDHDVSIFKCTPSVILSMNIGEEPGDSLFGGEEEENGKVYVALHDTIFDKSNFSTTLR